MTGGFAGWASEHYATYRRDIPDAIVSQLVAHFALDRRSRLVDIGAGTGQVVVPLARRVGMAIVIEPEPDLLRRLRDRPDFGDNTLTVLGTDRDLPLLRTADCGQVNLVTVANALHFMAPAEVFINARDLLRPGGGIAIISHGTPLWLADTEWAREVNRFLQDWLGASTGGQCGVDDRTRADRATILAERGFVDVTVLRHEYTAQLTSAYVVGHLYSALPQTQVPVDRRDVERTYRVCTIEVMSTVQQPHHRGRINLRVDPEQEDRLRAAADLNGETLTGFLLAAGGDRAAEVLDRSRRITVSSEAFQRFVAALDAPAEPMPTLAGYAAGSSPIPAR